jgi:hypothetical protein
VAWTERLRWEAVLRLALRLPALRLSTSKIANPNGCLAACASKADCLLPRPIDVLRQHRPGTEDVPADDLNLSLPAHCRGDSGHDRAMGAYQVVA